MAISCLSADRSERTSLAVLVYSLNQRWFIMLWIKQRACQKMNFTKKEKLLSNFIKLVCEDKNN